MKKVVFVFLLGMFVLACGSSDKNAPSYARGNDETKEASAGGEKIFNTYCVVCHGKDGKLALNGAKDLTLTSLSLDERITLITKGKGLMTPFDGILKTKEIEAVAKYSMSLNPNN